MNLPPENPRMLMGCSMSSHVSCRLLSRSPSSSRSGHITWEAFVGQLGYEFAFPADGPVIALGAASLALAT